MISGKSLWCKHAIYHHSHLIGMDYRVTVNHSLIRRRPQSMVLHHHPLSFPHLFSPHLFSPQLLFPAPTALITSRRNTKHLIASISTHRPFLPNRRSTLRCIKTFSTLHCDGEVQTLPMSLTSHDQSLSPLIFAFSWEFASSCPLLLWIILVLIKLNSYSPTYSSITQSFDRKWGVTIKIYLHLDLL